MPAHSLEDLASCIKKQSIFWWTGNVRSYMRCMGLFPGEESMSVYVIMVFIGDWGVYVILYQDLCWVFNVYR